MKKKTARVLVVTGIIVMALAFLWGVNALVAKASLNKAYAELEKAGMPMNPEDIIPPLVDDKDNGALLYQSAVLRLRAAANKDVSLLEELSEIGGKMLDDGVTPELIKRTSELSQSDAVNDAVRAIVEGNAKPRSRYDRDYEKGAEMALPHIGDLRDLTTALHAIAMYQAAEGNTDQAWTTALASLELSKAVEEEPLLISQLVRIAMVSISTSTIETLASRSRPSDQVCEKIIETLDSMDSIDPLVMTVHCERVLMGEWCFALLSGETSSENVSKMNYFQVLSNIGGGNSIGERALVAYSLLLDPYLHGDHAEYLRIMKVSAESMETLPHKDEAAKVEDAVMNLPRRNLLSRTIIPAMSHAKMSYYQMIAEIRILRAGLKAILAAKDGKLPDKVITVNTSDALDPFSGQPLRYEKKGKGFLIYSFGKNMKDDSGTESKNRREGDIVWSFEPAWNL